MHCTRNKSFASVFFFFMWMSYMKNQSWMFLQSRLLESLFKKSLVQSLKYCRRLITSQKIFFNKRNYKTNREGIQFERFTKKVHEDNTWLSKISISCELWPQSNFVDDMNRWVYHKLFYYIFIFIYVLDPRQCINLLDFPRTFSNSMVCAVIVYKFSFAC